MSELRRDPLRGHWSIIAAERGKRPSDYERRDEPSDSAESCPFCPGHEYATPPELMATRIGGTPPNTPGWSNRLVPNRYPALGRDPDPVPDDGRLTERRRGFGSHEVLVATPDHTRHWSRLTVDQWDRLLSICQHRMSELWRDAQVKHVTLFINHGAAAGASRQHPHMQLMALPLVPPVLETLNARFRAQYAVSETCLMCDIIADEEKERARIVSDDLAYVTFAPFASRVPYELCIAPRAHRGSFLSVPNGERRRFALHLRGVLERLQALAADVPFNFVLHTVCAAEPDPKAPFHWHAEILPRLSSQAGLEWGSGMYLNAVAPEQAAQQLTALLM